MSFNFELGSEDTFQTLKTLIKLNQGLFKSLKQSRFLFERYSQNRPYDTVESVKKNFGIDLAPGQCLAEVNASVRWADYGTRSWRPVCWMFVVDKYGVVAQYKLKFVGESNTGTSPDPSKTQLLWERTCEVKEFEVPAEPTPSEFVSHKGRRIVITGTVTKIRSFPKVRYHYYDSDVGYLTQIKVDNNIVIYWGKLNDVNEGETVTVKATIKDHSIKDGIKQTIINRPVIIKEEEVA